MSTNQFLYRVRNTLFDCLMCALALCGLTTSAAIAQISTYPDKPVTLIIPFAPGAGTDAMGRLLAVKLADEVKEKIIVENKTGASGALPQVPSMSESGLNGFDVLNYYGIVAPVGTPVNIVGRLNAVINRIVAMPDIVERFARDAVDATPGTPAQLAQFIASDYEAWRVMVKEQNLKIE